MCAIGTPRPTAANVADILEWAAKLGAGTVAIDLDGSLSSLLVERAGKGALDNVDVRLLTPSSPVGIPVTFKPLSGLSSAPHTEAWKRVRAWVPQLLATLAGAGPGSPEHDKYAAWFIGVLDRTKEANPSILTVQGLVAAIKEALVTEGSPVTDDVAKAMETDLADLAEDLRNAALSYGAPVNLKRLLDTPVKTTETEPTPDRHHLDVILLDHMTQVADRNSMITALLLEVFAWCRISGKSGRLMVVLPEVESPAAFLATRPFVQRLTTNVLKTSGGTGLLAIVLPRSMDDPTGMPRFSALLLERAVMDSEPAKIEAVLTDQGMTPSGWQRMSMLSANEWALAAGAEWSKWHRFSPDADAARERELDTETLARILPVDSRDVFSHRPELEEEGDESEEGDSEDQTGEAKEAARAARAVEDAEDLISLTTEVKSKKTSRVHQEVQELLKRKLEEKERAKEAQRYELQEMDLVEGEEPSDLEVSAHKPRPLAEGVIDDHRDTDAGAPRVDLHADDLQVELAVMEAREAEGVPGDGEDDEDNRDVVIDLDHVDTSWETISPESALGAEAEPEAGPRKKTSQDDQEGEEEEEIIVELDED
jgi:hypothetical protein